MRLIDSVKKYDNVSLIETSKFKNITLSFRYGLKYSPKLKASLLVLSNMLFETSVNYDTKVKMATRKDLLYGFNAQSMVNCYGNVLVFNASFDFVNPRFLKDVTVDDYIAFIDELLLNPLLDNEKLNESKKNTSAALKRRLDNPSSLASDNFYEEISKDDSKFNIYCNGNLIEIIENIELKDIEEAYRLLSDSRLDIYLIGDIDEKLLSYLNKFKSNNNISMNDSSAVYNPKEEITFKKKVSQSTLIYSYSTPFNRSHEDYIAFNLGNIVFGGIPTSLLFSNVREKHSLCYSIAAISLKNDGIVMVKTLIDRNNKEKAVKDIEEQFNCMINGDYDESVLISAKQMLMNNLMSIDDDIDYLLDHLYINDLRNCHESLDEYIDKMLKVTKEDISRVFRQYVPYLTYFLEGNLDD